MNTGLDLVKRALRNINSYQPGETISDADAQDAMDVLNDLLDSMSTDELYVFGSIENVLTWVAGQNQYTVGNPTNDVLGYNNITGTIAGTTITVTGTIPSQLVAGTSILNASTLTDSQGVIAEGTYVTAIGASTITISASATSTGADTIYWTVPGDFGIARPLRINGGYTRISQLDFPIDVYATQDQYNAVLYKQQPAPWPTMAWYNPAFPYGILNVYQTPGQSGELHLFTDTILSNLELTSTLVLPQGYRRMLSWLLARELAPEYGYAFTPLQSKLCREAIDFIKALNSQPAARATYDRMLTRGSGRGDGSWILTGGMR